MTLLDRILAPLGYLKAQPKPPAPLMAMAQGSRWEMPEAYEAEKQARLYAALTWIATAVDHCATIGAPVPFSVRRVSGEPGGADDEDLPNHPLEVLLRRPNPSQSGAEFKRDFLSWYKVSGNAYIYLNKPSETAVPDELWVMPSTMMRPIPDGRSYIAGYEFTAPNKTPVALEPWRVLHLKTFNPLNPFVGLSPLQSLALDAYGDLEQQKWNLAYFGKNNGKLPSILAFKHRIDDPQWRELLRQRDEEWGGTNRPGVTMLRGVGDLVQWLPAALSQKEMEFLEGRTFTKQEIYDKLAPGLSSILAVNATEANAIAGKATLIEAGVYPLLQQLADKFTSDILPLYGDNLVGEFDDIRVTNRILDLQEMQEYAKYHTVNEVRAEYYDEDPLYLTPEQAAHMAEEEAQAQERRDALPAAMQAQAGKAATPKLDPRGLLFAAQIGPSTPLPGEKAPSPPPPATPPMMQQPGDTLPETAQPADAQAADAEMAKWEKFALNRLDRGGREFEPRIIDVFTAARIKAALGKAHTREAVRAVFASQRQAGNEIDRLAAAIEAATAKL